MGSPSILLLSDGSGIESSLEQEKVIKAIKNSDSVVVFRRFILLIIRLTNRNAHVTFRNNNAAGYTLPYPLIHFLLKRVITSK